MILREKKYLAYARVLSLLLFKVSEVFIKAKIIHFIIVCDI